MTLCRTRLRHRPGCLLAAAAAAEGVVLTGCAAAGETPTTQALAFTANPAPASLNSVGGGASSAPLDLA